MTLTRASTAEVRSAGPFSVFAGIERTLCVLEGRLALTLLGQPPLILASDSTPLAFPGDLAVHADPGGAPVVDLNVMVRRGRFHAVVTRLDFCGRVRRDCEAATTLLFALAPLRVEAGAEALCLSRSDALMVTGKTHCVLDATATRADCYLIEITAVAGAGRT